MKQAATGIAAMPVSQLAGVGVKISEKLQRLAIYSIQDLLFHLPSRYEDRTQITAISKVHAGMYTSIKGEVKRTDIQLGRRRTLVVTLSDGSASLQIRFFHFNAGIQAQFATGRWVCAYGEIRRGKHYLEILHPEYQLLASANEPPKQAQLTTIYPTTEGLKQKSIQDLVNKALAMLQKIPLIDHLPQGLYPQQIPLNQAIAALHFPPADTHIEQLNVGRHPLQQRLIIEEMLAHQLAMLKIRQQTQRETGISLPYCEQLKEKLLASLPFTPTAAQQRVVQEIEADLQRPFPMMRLVQGDVGSGKTLVAALAATQAVTHGYQVALMAPTELLAEQHAINMGNWFEPLGVTVGWLAGKVKGKAKQNVLSEIAQGEVQVVVGTHALFQEQVHFSKLALVIVDEQHRFGVHQRLSLKEKGKAAGLIPHQLIMTATPIPRTLAMTAYADLATSVIDELPPGRTPIQTVAVPDTRRDEIVARIKDACQHQGKQAYWVCTLIDESETLEAQAAEDTAQQLQQDLPELKIGLVHGRMKASEKQAVMQAFKENSIQLLVATTVIEVGVDVPNASLMIIENPERLGLAQLHQLRGRVGRGQVASHCVLVFHAPLSKTARQRLNVLRESNDGFYIAEQDLEIRGPGEVLGTRQTGAVVFKIADLMRDQAFIPTVQEIAEQMITGYPQECDHIINRWIGDKSKYKDA